MPGVRASLKELLGTEDLYDALGVKKESSAEQLKRGYHKKSLVHHPDRVKEEDKEEATKRSGLCSVL